MRLRFFLILSLTLGAAALPLPVPGAPVEVVKTVTTNPTLRFRGVTGNPELTAQMERFFRASGWFDLTSREDAQYTLSGRVEGDRVLLDYGMGGAPLGTLSAPTGSDARTLAKQLVDSVLEFTFREIGVKGFCNTRIAFAAETAKGIKEIFLCDIDGDNIERLTDFRTLCVEPCFFPNGQSVGYTRYNRATTDVLETRIQPRMSRRLTAMNGLNVGVAFAPAGDRIALISSAADDHWVDLYVKPLGPGPMQRLTRSQSVEASPVWSPDGKRICFVSDETGSPRLFLIDADGGNKQRLPSLGSEAVTPDWSSDDKIVYATRIGGAYTVAVLDLKTGENRRVTEEPGVWESPAWAPDRRHVVCKRSDGPRSSLYVIDTLTGKARKLVATSNNLSMPSWSKAALK